MWIFFQLRKKKFQRELIIHIIYDMQKSKFEKNNILTCSL